jgi:hypothetical protein
MLTVDDLTQLWTWSSSWIVRDIVIEVLPQLSVPFNLILALYPSKFHRFTLVSIFKSSLYLLLTDETQPSKIVDGL